MACNYPKYGIRITNGNEDRYEHPCNRCKPCLKRRKQELTLRIELERKCYPDNKISWITLTYRDEFLPFTTDKIPLQTVKPKEVTNFLKSLRKQLNNKIRYMLVGEYGDNYNRPHYHLILFGAKFDEISDQLYKAWSIPKSKAPPLKSVVALKGINEVKARKIKNIDYLSTPSPISEYKFGKKTPRIPLPVSKSITDKRVLKGTIDTAPYVTEQGAYASDYLAKKQGKHIERSETDTRELVFRRSSRMPGLGRAGISLLAEELKNKGIAFIGYPETQSKSDHETTWQEFPQMLSVGHTFTPQNGLREKFLSLDTYCKKALLEDMCITFTKLTKKQQKQLSKSELQNYYKQSDQHEELERMRSYSKRQQNWSLIKLGLQFNTPEYQEKLEQQKQTLKRGEKQERRANRQKPYRFEG